MVKVPCSVRAKSADEQAENKSTETPTDVTLLPVTSEKQRTVVYLLHCGLYRSLKSFNFLERLCLPHKVQSVEDSFPECSYITIPILLLFQSLQ